MQYLKFQELTLLAFASLRLYDGSGEDEQLLEGGEPGMRVRLLNFLGLVAGQKEVDCDAASVEQLIQRLGERLGERFRQEAFLKDGFLRPDITVLVNGRNIQFLQGMATPLNPGDEVTLIPPVAGG